MGLAGSIGGLVDGLLPLWISWKVWVWARALVLIVVGVVGILVVVGVLGRDVVIVVIVRGVSVRIVVVMGLRGVVMIGVVGVMIGVVGVMIDVVGVMMLVALVVVGVLTVVGVGGVSMRSVGVRTVPSVVLVRSGVGSVRSGL